MPFVVAFGIIGLILSVLIVVNVVSGAVVAGYRRIGMLKSIGFTPGQVVATYAGQVTVPALAGCLAGSCSAMYWPMPLLGRTANVVPGRHAGGAALGGCRACRRRCAAWPGLQRCARPCGPGGSARSRRSRPGARRCRAAAMPRTACSARLRLPRPVTIGLAAPFARPARTAVTLVAVLLGATTVTFAVGLTSVAQPRGGRPVARAGRSRCRSILGLEAGRRPAGSRPGRARRPGPASRRPGRRSGTIEAALRAQAGHAAVRS